MKYMPYAALKPNQSQTMVLDWTPETEELLRNQVHAEFRPPLPSEEIVVFMVVYRKKDPDESPEDILKRFRQAAPGLTP